MAAMAGRLHWPDTLRALEAQGWIARVIPVARLGEAWARLEARLGLGELPEDVASLLAEATAPEMPTTVAAPRSIVIAATARPLTQASLSVAGAERVVPVPPHYAGYHTVPALLEAALGGALASFGFAAALCRAPLKTLAAGAGLSRYGRNNITYVPELGSYLLLAACVTDAPPPDDAAWGEALQLERCTRCSACVRACPTGAIAADRFLLHTERCLTWVNESDEPFPAWVDPAWHTCAVGCLRCQQVCPENVGVDLVVRPAEWFDAEETAAILDAATLTGRSQERMASCGLDYSPTLIARNLRALLGL